MKYCKKIILFIVLCLPFSVFASTKTFTRTPEKPLTPPDVIVDNNYLSIILKTPAVDSSEKLYDFADLYTDKEEEKLLDQIKLYIDSSKIDLAIVTTKDLCGFTISDYAYHFYDFNDFKREGIIFVIYVDEQESSIYMANNGDETGTVFTLYNDSVVKKTLHYVYKDIKTKNYYSATDNFIKILQGFYNLDHNGNYRINKSGEIVEEIPWIEIIILGVTLTFIIDMIFIYRIKAHNRLVLLGGLGTKLDESTLMVKVEKDELIDTFVTTKK